MAIDVGNEFSAPKANRLEELIAWVKKNPDCTLHSGEGGLLAAEITRLRDVAEARIK